MCDLERLGDAEVDPPIVLTDRRIEAKIDTLIGQSHESDANAGSGGVTAALPGQLPVEFWQAGSPVPIQRQPDASSVTLATEPFDIRIPDIDRRLMTGFTMSETIHTTDRESVGLAPTINSVAREGNREHAIQARALAILVGGILGTTSRDDLEGLAHKDFGSGNAAWPTLPSSRSLEFHSVEACNRPPNSTGSITHLVVTRIPRGIE
jgi:hypothetical protein